MKRLVKGTIIAAMALTVLSCSKEILKEADSVYLNYQTKTELELPFHEEWWVFWGGRSVGENYHTLLREQRFALDIVQRVDRKTHTGNGNQNEDYHCFGKRLNAPGSGKIVDVVNDIEDNIPGQFNQDSPTGNRVIIDHENGEFSILAHFKKGSIIVSVGDAVIKGQELGKAGNSGNSSEPHLHYHLQTTGDPFNGEGLPAQFQNYYADQTFVKRGEPVKTESIVNDKSINIYGTWNATSFIANEPLFDINNDGINSTELLDELPCRYSELVLNTDFTFYQENNTWSYNQNLDSYGCIDQSEVSLISGTWSVNSNFSLLSLTIEGNTAFLEIDFDDETLQFNSSEIFLNKNSLGEPKNIYGKVFYQRNQ